MDKSEQNIQTSTSFYSRHGFEYRDSIKHIQYEIISQNHIEQIRKFIINESSITQQKLMLLFTEINKQNDQFIANLLNQLTQQYKRSRLVQQQCQRLQRQKTGQGRRLSQYIVQLTSQLYGERKSTISIHQNVLQEISHLKIVQNCLAAQNKGLKRLIQEYEVQLGVMLNKIDQLKQQIKVKDNNIVELMKQTLVSKQKNTNLTSEHESLVKKLQQYIQAQKESHKIQQKYRNFQQLTQNIILLEQQNRNLTNFLQQKLDIITNLQTQNSQLEKKQKQTEKKLLKLEQTILNQKNKLTKCSDISMTKMKSLQLAYKKKLLMMCNVLKKEIKNIYNFYIKMKANVQKQMIMFKKSHQKDMANVIQSISMQWK